MPTQGFEFAWNMDGTNRVPAAIPMPINGTTAIKKGDALVVNSAGKLIPIVAGVTEVTAIALQDRPAAGAVDGDIISVSLVRKEYQYRCSANAASTSGVNNGFNKTMDVTDQRTVKVSATTGGTLILWNKDTLDEAGNIKAYVSFSNTTAP